MPENQKGFGLVGVALTLMVIAFVSIVGWKVYTKQLNSNAKESKSVQVDENSAEETECESKPISGMVIFDVVQPAPFVDTRVNEIQKDINASRLTWRDGTIIKIDGKDHSSGKYVATVEEGSEESAITLLNNKPYVTYAAQGTTFCPVKTKVKVE